MTAATYGAYREVNNSVSQWRKERKHRIWPVALERRLLWRDMFENRLVHLYVCLWAMAPPLTHPLILWLTRLIQGEGKHEKSNMAAARVTRPWYREMPLNRSGCALAQGEGAAIVSLCVATEAQTLMCSIGRRVLCSSIKGVSGSLKVKNDLDERTFCWSLQQWKAVINKSQASFKIYWYHLLIKTYIHQVIL